MTGYIFGLTSFSETILILGGNSGFILTQFMFFPEVKEPRKKESLFNLWVRLKTTQLELFLTRELLECSYYNNKNNFNKNTGKKEIKDDMIV